MVVFLAERVIEIGCDSLARHHHEAGQAVAFLIPQSHRFDRKYNSHHSKSGLLTTHPVRPSVGRVANTPISKQLPKRILIARILGSRISPSQRVSPRKSAQFPNPLNVLHSRITDQRPMW